MIVADEGKRWVVVHRDKDDPVVRRYPVDSGWLYQVSVEPGSACRATDGSYFLEQLTWHPPSFVPSTAARASSTG